MSNEEKMKQIHMSDFFAMKDVKGKEGVTVATDKDQRRKVPVTRRQHEPVEELTKRD